MALPSAPGGVVTSGAPAWPSAICSSPIPKTPLPPAPRPAILTPSAPVGHQLSTINSAVTSLEKALRDFAQFAAKLKGDEKSEAQTFLFHLLAAFGHDSNTLPEGSTSSSRINAISFGEASLVFGTAGRAGSPLHAEERGRRFVCRAAHGPRAAECAPYHQAGWATRPQGGVPNKSECLTIDTLGAPTARSRPPTAGPCANSIAPSKPPAPTAFASPTRPSTPPSARPAA